MALRLHEHSLREVKGFLAVACDPQTPCHDPRIVPAEELLQPDARPTATRSEVIRHQIRIRQRFQIASIMKDETPAKQARNKPLSTVPKRP